MKILVVSDIHGNYPAILALRETYDLCLNIGDLVDYGPCPKECVRWSMENCLHTVRGNHDHGVAQGVEVLGDYGYRYLTRVTRPFGWSSLDAEERRYLLQLPLTKRFVLEGKKFLLVHGTPRDPLDEYVMRDVNAWARRLENVDADIVIVGHTHLQFCLSVGSKTVLNPGSLGQPRDGDPRAAYAVIDDKNIVLKRIEYPIEDAVAKFNELDVPERAKELFRESLVCGKLSHPKIPPKAGD